MVPLSMYQDLWKTLRKVLIIFVLMLAVILAVELFRAFALGKY